MKKRDTRWSLPLADHPKLDLQTDMARVTVVGVAPGEAPWLEVESSAPHADLAGASPAVEVDGRGDTTHVRVAATWLGDPSWWSGPWWESSFWEKRFAKPAFRVSVVAHVPLDVRGVLKSNAAKMRVSGLSGCDLGIETDAGSLVIEDVSGSLRLATQAGRIDARRISGALDIATSAGAVTVDVLSLSPGTHRIRTNVGAVRLELARGMPVRIAARTTFGATRIDFPTSDDAPALLDIAADLGAIRVVESSRRWDEASVPAGPYRTATLAPSRDDDEEEIARVLSRVADGSITPETARDLLRALGVT